MMLCILVGILVGVAAEQMDAGQRTNPFRDAGTQARRPADGPSMGLHPTLKALAIAVGRKPSEPTFVGPVQSSGTSTLAERSAEACSDPPGAGPAPRSLSVASRIRALTDRQHSNCPSDKPNRAETQPADPFRANESQPADGPVLSIGRSFILEDQHEQVSTPEDQHEQVSTPEDQHEQVSRNPLRPAGADSPGRHRRLGKANPLRSSPAQR
jgi:hypothetical protein